MAYLTYNGKLIQSDNKFVNNFIPSPILVKYGYLYNFYAAVDARNIANTDWHVATVAEYTTLTNFLGTTTTAGTKLKESGTTYWLSGNTGNNLAKFNARGAGNRWWYNGTFGYLQDQLYLWTSGSRDATYAFNSMLRYDNGTIAGGTTYNNKKVGCSIRLMKDSTILSDGESGTYTGNDGKLYRTICIGTQEWLADNLCETLFRDLSTITTVHLGASWAALTAEGKCSYNDNDSNILI